MPAIADLNAAPSWRSVDFISDLHLHAGDAVTFATWQHYMHTTPADAIFILGDLFEAWVGDDVVIDGLSDNFASSEAGFEGRCAQVLQQTGARLDLFFMHGNRDFLVGQRLMNLCHARLLDDPTVLAFPPGSGQHLLLSHGDALCIDDIDYMRFRGEVRSAEWQQAFLAKPLAVRQEIARGLRQQSEAKKRSGATYADADSRLAVQWLQAACADTLIHGHTHRPAVHALPGGMSRLVLSDWDAGADPPRAQVVRLSAAGLQRINLV